MIPYNSLYSPRRDTSNSFFDQLTPAKPGQVSSSSIGSTPFGRSVVDFSGGVPAGSLGVGFTTLPGGGVVFSPKDTNPNSYDMKFGPTNANSAAMKSGLGDPSANAAYKVPVPLDTAARQIAGGGQLQWDSLHNQWTIAGGFQPTQDQLSQAYNRLNQVQQPAGTLALNNLLKNQR